MLWHGKNFRGFLNKAKEVLFNNTGTTLTSTNVEDAIKEVNSNLSDLIITREIRMLDNATVTTNYIEAETSVAISGYKAIALSYKTNQTNFYPYWVYISSSDVCNVGLATKNGSTVQNATLDVFVTYVKSSCYGGNN